MKYLENILLYTLVFVMTASVVFLVTMVGAASFDAVKGTLSPKADPIVRVLVKGGSGTAFHIGNGNFLTASHVASEGTVSLVVNDGEVPAEVVWTNKAYDVTLLRAIDPVSVNILPLNCTPLSQGMKVHGIGYPKFGRFEINLTLAGKPQSHGPWKIVYPMSGQLLWGMSGGPSIRSGEAVGVNVGVDIQQIGMGGTVTNVSMVVPMYEVCKLLNMR